MDHIAVDNFCAYLRIKTVQPKPDYAGSTAFLKKMAADLGLISEVYQCVEGKPIVIMTWQGSDASAKSILLNSHTDVVPVVAEKWSCDPFEAVVDDQNRIRARGAQDMKCVGIGYLEGIRRLKQNGFIPTRTIHLTFVPDEEIDGADGMRLFVHTDRFKAMNAGVALDEGVPSPFKHMFIFNEERAPWWIKIVAHGVAGHGSTLPQGSATEKLFRVMEKIYAFRNEQVRLLAGNLEHLGEVTSVNITKLSCGVQTNVIPTEASMTLDVRVSPRLGQEAFSKILAEWTSEQGLEVVFEAKNELQPASPVTEDHPFYAAISDSLREFGFDHAVRIFTGATDSRYIRGVGVPAYGISPFNMSPILLHDHDEYLDKDIFLQGVRIYEKVIAKLSNA